MTCGDAGGGASAPEEGFSLKTSEPPCEDEEDAEKLLGSCLWAYWGRDSL